MATSGDIRDIMDLGHDGPRQPALKKKKKNLEAQPRLTGISREVQALMGDSVPPVAIVETPKYKQKPSVTMKMFKPRHWEEKQFVHGARKDGLQLKHWKRSIPGSNIRVNSIANIGQTDTEMTDGDATAPSMTELRFEDEFPSEKWNVEVQVKKYDSEQYDKFFKSEEWTKEETDYLMQICQDYDLRWLLIADRYDPNEIVQLKDEDDASIPTYLPRRMEELKQRYYTIAAKMLELQTPASNMTQSEFQLWEKMRNFDARTEVQRKAMAEKLFERTKEEAEEEKVLLEELYRITKNEDDFIKMRKELYSRLETAPSLRRNERGEEPSTALYQTSQGLSMLLSSLLAKEKRLKPRAPPTGPEAASASQTPTDAQRPRHGHQASRRETMDSTAADDNAQPMKKGSISQAPVVRVLSPAEEVKFGVSHPQERLTSGVMFRHEKINRLTMAKSQVQTQKIGAALTELGIPPRLLMPTERVCREFERLVSEVQILLDTRRVLEKVSSEVKVLEEHKRLRLGGGEDGAEVKDGENDNQDAMEMDNTAALARQQNKAGVNKAAREGVEAAGAALNESKPGVDRDNTQISSAGEDENIDGTQDKDDEDEDAEDIEDSRLQAEEEDDDDNDNEVDQSAMADEDEEAEDVDQSYAQAEDEDDDEEAADQGDEDEDEETQINLGDDEDDEDDDDAPGLEDLERANQVTDDEDEDNEDENDNEVDQSQFAEDDEEEEQPEDEEEDEDGDGDDGDNQAEVDESMVNGENEDEDEDQEGAEVEEEVSRPTSSHSHMRAHKRSASVLSDASRAGSNRSGASRKRRK